MILRAFTVSCILAAATTPGCASGHAVMRGSVVMKIDPTTAHVRLGSGEVTVNDRVRVYKNVCRRAGFRAVCNKQTIAEGTVKELLDARYSIVAFPPGTAFEEGNTVEKL